MWLAKTCHRLKCRYFYLSSAWVFSGDSDRIYTEDDYPESYSELGEGLLRSEQAVRDGCQDYALLRLGPLFSADGDEMYSTVLKQVCRGELGPYSASMRTSPIAVEDGGRVVSAMIDQLSVGAECHGIYHYDGAISASLYEFAEAVEGILKTIDGQASKIGQLTRNSAKIHTGPGLVLDCARARDTYAIKPQSYLAYLPQVIHRFFEKQRAAEQGAE